MLVGRLSREGADTTVTTSRARWLDRQAVGTLLILAGVISDSTAGWLALAKADLRSIPLHVLAIAVWALGLGIVHRATVPSRQAGSGDDATRAVVPGLLMRLLSGGLVPEINGWTVAALLLGLFLFPGMAPLGWCLGIGLTWMYRQVWTSSVATMDSALPAGDETARSLPTTAPLLPSELLMRASAEPLVDVIDHPSVDVRRGAVAILGKQSGPEAVYLLTRFLTDEHADVRLDASVTLARLESHLTEAVDEAADRYATDPAAARTYAERCCEYSRSGLLDQISARFYLTEARTALRRHLAREAEDVDAWTALARVHRDLGDLHEALVALDHARALAPGSAEAHLLAMQVAYELHSWAKLEALARTALELPNAQLEVREAARWWAATAEESEAIEDPAMVQEPGPTEASVDEPEPVSERMAEPAIEAVAIEAVAIEADAEVEQVEELETVEELEVSGERRDARNSGGELAASGWPLIVDLDSH
jgi:tetratricopeptide (TPR) repeat protein